MTDPVRKAIDAFLSLVDGGQCPPNGEEPALLTVIDHLVVAMRNAPSGEVSSEVDAPTLNWADVRKRL